MIRLRMANELVSLKGFGRWYAIEHAFQHSTLFLAAIFSLIQTAHEQFVAGEIALTTAILRLC